MVKFLSVFAIFLGTVLCENEFTASSQKSLVTDHNIRSAQPLQVKDCTRRFFPNPVIDSDWVPAVSNRRESVGIEPDSVRSNNALSENAKTNSDIQDPADELSTKNYETQVSRDNADVTSSQNGDLPQDEEVRNAKNELESQNDPDCFSENQNYRRFNADSTASQNSASYHDNQDEDDDELQDPVRRSGVTDLSDPRSSFIGKTRVCYACTSASSENCLSPDRRTTIKYCQRNHDSCVTKTYNNNQNGLVVIRDCASSCRQPSVTGLDPKYNSCKICHSDLCNSASTANSQAFLILLFIGTLFKCVKSSNIM